MNKAYLLIGGNIGDRNKNLNEAIDFIARECGSVTKSSSIYETAAWGKTDQPDFLNQCLLIQTSLTAPDLMKQILRIEEKMGRKRKEKNDPRIIDIDILFFNAEVLQTDFLTLPHPQLQNRRFVLVPLTEIAPMLVHPVLKKTITTLLKECPDKLEVKKLK